MTKSKQAYLLMVAAAAVFAAYVLYANFIHDPQATAFLGRKTNLARTLHVQAWLKVMYVHVAFACVGMVAGAVNFSSAIRRKHLRFHRLNGYLYLASVLIVVVTSGYMAPYATGGKINSMAFNVLNIVWPAMTIVAVVMIRKKQVNKHRKWMARSYAYVFTNMAIHLLTSLFHNGFGLAYPTSYTIGVCSAIVLLPLAAELVIRTAFRKPAASV